MTSSEKGRKKQRETHILHQLNGLTGVIWVIYYTHGRTGHPPYQNWLPSRRFLHTQKLVTRVSVSGYLCDIYDHLFFMKKNSKFFFNKGHILHRLDGLTSVIWVIYYTHGKNGHPPYQNWLPSHRFLNIYWHTQNWLPVCL